ncbi:MAG: ankyrin repeat domain-containing protein [Bacteroidetes bacterium]|nr:ankyrin repeat domain-containing protein [Bacteroidota bacterium]
MSFFKKLFNTGKKKATTNADENLPWIEASDNQWGIRLLDLRPISQTMVSTSTDPQMAHNAISYSAEDGTSFWGHKPDLNRTIPSTVILPIDGYLAPGVLFVPDTMEHKWAIYFDGDQLIFVRSWLRKVFVVAKTKQANNQLMVEQITGAFTDNESADFTNAVLNFLLISHAIGETVPAPLPKELGTNSRDAGLWAFSSYGNMAHIGTFDEKFKAPATGKLRTHSLLHIAVAKSEIDKIEQYIRLGININSLAGDGLASLHWSLAAESTNSLRRLLELGADPNVKSLQGATALMNAVQSNKLEQSKILLGSGALVNERDNRGFTALHRAAEMGHIELVQLLLINGADKSIEADGHTAISLATARGNKEIIELLS